MGWTPVTWEGWLLTAGTVGTIGVATLLLVTARTSPDVPEWVMVVAWVLWAVVIVAACSIMLVVSRQRTEGEWRWRWGRGPGRRLQS
jgi:hypothetical protein